MRWAGVVGAVFLISCSQGGLPGLVQAPDGGTGGSDGGSQLNPPDGGTDHDPVDDGVRHWPPSRAGYVNPITAENQRQGDPSWNRGFTNPWAAQIEAYADRVSAKPGDVVQLMARSDRPGATASWTLYRIGWYGGAGARALTSGTVQVPAQGACSNNTQTGLIRCSWAPTFTVTIPRDAVSGLYLVRIVRTDHIGVMIPVVVRDDRQADLLFQSSVLTAQAYNNWGGEGLYSDSNDHVPGGFALQVTFDRPYDSDSGSGQVLKWEALMARFLERYGYDVTYTTNLDVVREGSKRLIRRGAFLSVGHDEYWPGEERDIIEAARDAGMPLYFFGANAAYWKVRLSEPGVDGNARVVTCYKRRPQNDPMAGTPQQTGRFRDDPIHRAEEELVGTMYESWMLFGQAWTAGDTSHPLYAGTGLSPGDTIPQLVGYEYDRTFDLDTPGPVTVLARSPLVDAEGKPGFAEATLYTAPGGAQVFGAGSIYWSRGLDGPLRDARVERMTANVLQMGSQLSVPQQLMHVGAPPAPAADPQWASSVRTVATGMPGPSGVAQLPDGTFVIADVREHRIWQTDGGGSVWPFAGDGNPDGNPRFDNVPGLSARFFQPTAVLPDGLGNVYVADTHNCAIRKIANDARRTVTTVAGQLMNCGYVDAAGGAARLSDPMGMAWLDATHIVIADTENFAIRVLDVTTHAVTTLARTHDFGEEADGPAASASFFYPTAVAVAPDGRVFFLASSFGELKVIGTDASRTITSLTTGGIGFADGPGTAARMQPQMGLLWWNGGLLVGDSANQRLRFIVPGATAGSTVVKTWAGSGRMGADDGPASAASFEVPLGLWPGKDGLIYAVDGGAGALRAVTP
ncbi:MAG TPA: N,N-dimethylformamidase beta subunit family domain-containing protein [Myxococcales bacterium]|nr:N,N-dimethylformamidase beta subunit family domain-containing protein [Myxococcales bacterium]